MEYTNPKHILDSTTIEAGKIRWRSPSNIALVKYWGKYGQQQPRNPSISLTLSQAATDTTLSYSQKESETEIDLDFYFAGEHRPDFAQKVEKYFRSLLPVFPFFLISVPLQTHPTLRTFSGIPTFEMKVQSQRVWAHPPCYCCSSVP